MIGNTAEASERAPVDNLSLVLPTRVIVYAWGEKYVGELLSLTLPALLSPGNLPYVAETVPCEVVVLTEERLFPRFLADATVVRLQEFCPLRLFALDDLVSAPDKYGIALTHVLHRGFADLRSSVIDSWLMFLNADFILADGSLRNLLKRLAAGERLVASPSYCVNAEAVLPELLCRVDPHTRSLTLPPREMAGLVLRHRHNTIRGKTVNQSLFSIRYMDQFYWQVDDDTLLGHQMPIAIVGMRPERYLEEPNSYWDHGLMREFVSEATHCVIEDSDEFLMLELRGEDVAQDQLRLGWPEPAEIARNTTSFMTAYQRDMAQYPLTLHSRDLPADSDLARQQLRAFVDSVLAHLPAVLPSHLDHPQWNYHRPGFIKTRHDYLSKQLGRVTETDEPPTGLSQLDRIWWKLDGITKGYERRRTQLLDLRQHQRGVIARLVEQLEGWIDRGREEIDEKLMDEVRNTPILHASLERRVDTYRMLNVGPDLGPNDMPTAPHELWAAPFGRAEDLWIGLNREAETRREALAKAISWLDSHYENRIAMLDLEFQSVSAPLLSEYARLGKAQISSAAVPVIVIHDRPETPGGSGSIRSLARGAYRRVFGVFPRVTQLHPYWAPLRHLIRLVDEATSMEGAKVLAVVGEGGIAQKLPDAIGGMHSRVSRAEVMQGNLAAAFNHSREIDLCISALETGELPLLSQLVRALEPSMRQGGRILAFYPNFDFSPLPMEAIQVLRGFSDLPGVVRVYYAGSRQSARVVRRYRRTLAAPRGRVNAARIAAALFTSGPETLAANRLEASISDARLSRLPQPCSSITFEITLN